MDPYLIVRTLHIISATILFGTGIGIAFFMLNSHFTDNLQQKFFAAKTTVRADYIFTAPAVILQPLTGFWLIHNGGYDPMDLWLKLTYAIYIVAGLCWLPVVWIQIQMKKMIAASLETETELPPRYTKLFRIWVTLGIPAFIGLVAVFFLMVMRPQ